MLETPRYPNKSFDVMNTIFFPQSIQYPREEYTTRKLRGITYCSNFNYDTDISSTLDSNNVLFPVYKIHISKSGNSFLRSGNFSKKNSLFY